LLRNFDITQPKASISIEPRHESYSSEFGGKCINLLGKRTIKLISDAEERKADV